MTKKGKGRSLALQIKKEIEEPEIKTGAPQKKRKALHRKDIQRAAQAPICRPNRNREW
jgi:hypothetical protein